ncbi:MAG TPA: DUF2917 domain-containing protein [Caldimonas sp.]|nr:DUF2917 domain-containing protein [Caldimonas sp.]HEX2540371.1 DUF2917 domain-containing protein [Caldimonas sp.]
MNTQESWFLYDGASHLGNRGGTLRVEAGQVWLTRSGDLDDHILRAGETYRVPSGDVLVEPWHRGAVPARIVWEPSSRLAGWRNRLERTWAQWRDLVHSRRRLAVGSMAAAAALIVLASALGPLSGDRSAGLGPPQASGSVLHNAGEERKPDGREAGERQGIVAKEARRGKAGAA